MLGIMSDTRFTADAPPARLYRTALVSFLLGLVSLVLLPLGVVALVLGLRGLRAVNSSDGRLRGARLAVAGMVLGGLATLLLLVWFTVNRIGWLRQRSALATCTNNLRVIGLSLNKYAEQHKRFPSGTPGPRELPPEQRRSWMADVLPFMAEGRRIHVDFQAISDEIDRDRAWDDPANQKVANTTVRAFVCPDLPNYDPRTRPGLTTYVGVAGVGADAARLDRGDPLAGMFGYGRGVRQAEVTRGISETMMVVETAHENGRWLAGGFPTVRGFDPRVEHYIGPDRPFGGLHPDVMNVLMVDGSVRSVNENVAPEVLRSQATIHAER
jgi:prepilin-type processing-associated H-X9-DG protein